MLDGAYSRWRVLSTHVEVVLTLMSLVLGLWGALHARGGGPPLRRAVRVRTQCSPRTWRWSARVTPQPRQRGVLSTHVEVVRLPP